MPDSWSRFTVKCGSQVSSIKAMRTASLCFFIDQMIRYISRKKNGLKQDLFDKVLKIPLINMACIITSSPSNHTTLLARSKINMLPNRDQPAV